MIVSEPDLNKQIHSGIIGRLTESDTNPLRSTTDCERYHGEMYLDWRLPGLRASYNQTRMGGSSSNPRRSLPAASTLRRLFCCANEQDIRVRCQRRKG